MFADKRATQAGDVLTIVVAESTSATKNNQTSTSKQSSVNDSVSSFLYSPGASGLLTKGGQLPAMNFASKSTFAGGGSIANTENITAQAAVRVMDVLPNGNLVIEGKRETAFGGERTTQILRGVVRQEDVMANNTVYSYNVADATIQLITKGTITESQNKGWFHRLWDKYSPF
jgi:flagellar L-ring protein precursor FlgH